MANEYEDAFKGSPVTIIATKQKIHEQLEQLGKKDVKDGSKRQLQLSLSVLRALCLVVAKPEGKHCNLYCDILVDVLAPYLKPESSPKYWATYLEHLRYIHHLIIDKKLFTEAARICGQISKYTNSLQNETDYKLILGMYAQHLLSQPHHMRINAGVAQTHISQTLDDLIKLFTKMLHFNKELNFLYPELITDFTKYLVPKRAAPVFKFLASLPAKKTQMYDAFFKLLGELRVPQPDKYELQLYCQRHIEAVGIFIHLDATDRLQEQLALRHLRVCRDLPFLQNDKSGSYVFSLLYYLVKMVYGVPNGSQLTVVFKDLSTKMAAFFEKFGESLMRERWFTDVPVVISILLTHMHQHPTTPFSSFWKQMTNVECYIAHSELVLGSMRLAPHIAETKLLTIECCSSARKHTIISLVLSALAAFSSYMQNVQPADEIGELLVSFRTNLLLVMRHGVSVFDSLACITSISPELKMLYARFIQLTCDVRTKEQAKLCLTLAELLLRIRHKFSLSNWTLLLRRLYKMSVLAEDNKLTTELHVAHIASLIQESPWPDMTQLRNRIGIFYTASSHVLPGQSILQVNEQSHNPFKVFLEPHQKRLLHWLEMQQFSKYHRTITQLQLTLMCCSQSPYDEVLVGRGAVNLQSEVSNRLRKIKAELQQKALKPNGLKRLEHLILAHIRTSLLHDKLKEQKQSFPKEIKCTEDNLGDLLQYKELSLVTVTNEIKLIQKANEAVSAFREFYNKADTEPITCDEAFIDWEAILEDLASLALYLQLSGYLDSALEAWLLHYRIANTVQDQYSALRGLAYFCENAEHFDTPVLTQMNLADELFIKLHFLLDAVQQLPLLPKRLQNYVLICICQVAYFYARKENFSYAQALLNLVQQSHSELPEQQGKYNVVLGTMDIVKFRILWKHSSNDSRQETNDFMKKCLLREMEQTLDRFRGEFFKLTSSEVMSYTILLLSLIVQVAECAANRLCDYFVNSYFSGLFSILLQSASALRIVQLLTMWSWINLQMEYVKKAQIKLKLVEYIMGVKNLEDLRQLSEEAAAEKQSKESSLATIELLHSEVEPLRKVAPQHSSPIKTGKMQLNRMALAKSNLKRFLCTSKSASLEENEILQWCYFTVGCLNARLYFLGENYEQLDDFYESSQLWLESRKNILLSTNFQNIKLLNIQHYANYLRFHKKYEKALTCLNTALGDCDRIKGNVDSVYRVNFIVQLFATKNEMIQIKEKKKHSNFRRALTFNISPDLSDPEKCDKKTEIEAVKAMSSVTASARKKSKPAFKIYNNENESPKSVTQTNTIAITQSNKKRVNAVQGPIQTSELNEVVSSVRKAKRIEKVGEKKPLKQTSKTAFTPLGVRITKRSCKKESDSSSSSTPDTGADTILNYCQRIESIDLEDSDDQQEMPTVIKQSSRTVTNQREDILNICQRIESIDLVESSDHEKTETEIVSDGQKLTQPDINVMNAPNVIVVTDEIVYMTPKPTTIRTKTKQSNAKTTKSSNKASKTTHNKHEASEGDINKIGEDSNHTELSSDVKPSRVKLVEQIKITEETKAIKSKVKTPTKTEVRTLRVVSKEPTTEKMSPRQVAKGKVSNVNAASAGPTDGRTYSRTRKKKTDETEDVENIDPVAVKSTRKATTRLGKR